MDYLLQKMRLELELLRLGIGLQGSHNGDIIRYNENHDPETGRFTSGQGGGGSATLKKVIATSTVEGHESTPRTAVPNAIIDHKRGEVLDGRSYYNSQGEKIIDIHVNNHGHPKAHPYGNNGEHIHEYVWDNGVLIDRTT